MIIGVILVLQFAIYYANHKDDGGGHDVEMANALMSMIGGVVGIVMLITGVIAIMVRG